MMTIKRIGGISLLLLSAQVIGQPAANAGPGGLPATPTSTSAAMAYASWSAPSGGTNFSVISGFVNALPSSYTTSNGNGLVEVTCGDQQSVSINDGWWAVITNNGTTTASTTVTTTELVGGSLTANLNNETSCTSTANLSLLGGNPSGTLTAVTQTWNSIPNPTNASFSSQSINAGMNQQVWSTLYLLAQGH